MKQSVRTFPAILSLCLLFSSCVVAKPMKSVTANSSSQAASALQSSFPASSMAAASGFSLSASSISKNIVSSTVLSSASVSVKSAVSKTVKAVSKTVVAHNQTITRKYFGRMLEDLPIIVDANHFLYLTPTPFLYSNMNFFASPGQVIGRIYSNNVAFIEGESASKAVCVYSSSTKKWERFPLLCEDTITVQGRVYHFTDGSVYDLYHEKEWDHSSIEMLTPVSSDSVAVSSAISQNQDKDNSYILQIIEYPQIWPEIPLIKNKIIGRLPGGTVWSLNEIDPSQAVAIQSGNLWLLATKQVGYTGKTVCEVLEEWGITEAEIPW